MKTFTSAVVRWLLRDPDMPETVRQWRQEKVDDEEHRALLFAVRLAEDWGTDFCFETDRDRDTKSALINEVLLITRDRIDWQRVAEALLRHFTIPVIAASAVSDFQGQPRLQAPALWKAGAN